MMLEDQGRLGLSLRLGFSDESCRPFSAIISPYCLSQSIAEQSSGHTKGIDVNRAPAGDGGDEEEAGFSSPNSTVSSVNGGGGKRDYPEISDEEDGGTGEEGSRKKLRLTKEQSAILEQTFKQHSTLNPKQKVSLAKRLRLRPRQVEVWFQNRRARTKLKQNEVDCEMLRRYCENLAEENRRLQKEIQQLRTTISSPHLYMKTPHLYMKMRPPTTTPVTCPSCEVVGVPPSMFSMNNWPRQTKVVQSNHNPSINQRFSAT